MWQSIFNLVSKDQILAFKVDQLVEGASSGHAIIVLSPHLPQLRRKRPRSDKGKPLAMRILLNCLSFSQRNSVAFLLARIGSIAVDEQMRLLSFLSQTENLFLEHPIA
jgi:hypothetical protein